ncbi:MAG: hypothetical protein JOZ29_16480 [Deltaproteobacteria bacterium]|nr:hypothetical protein [Deltaproteobacteria bacterium]
MLNAFASVRATAFDVTLLDIDGKEQLSVTGTGERCGPVDLFKNSQRRPDRPSLS